MVSSLSPFPSRPTSLGREGPGGSGAAGVKPQQSPGLQLNPAWGNTAATPHCSSIPEGISVGNTLGRFKRIHSPGIPKPASLYQTPLLKSPELLIFQVSPYGQKSYHTFLRSLSAGLSPVALYPYFGRPDAFHLPNARCVSRNSLTHSLHTQ